MSNKQRLNRQRHEFLLTFFADQAKDKYATRIINNFTLVKQWNGTTERWDVAIFPPGAYSRKQERPCSKVSDKEQTTELPF